MGIGPLDPENVGWLLGRLDPTQHYLGWIFYRQSDWSSPLGLNPYFGLDISSSIVYSDSIPLLAIPLKVIAPYLPEHFQYFGIWLLACFILQSWFAWKILGLFTCNTVLRLLACGLLVFSPPMFWRLNTPAGGHAALVGHFLILWAIYLALRSSQSKRTLYWVLLLATAVLIHFYLFVIVVLIWLADLGNRYYAQRQINSKAVAKEILIAIVTFTLLAWQAGYFSITAALNNERGYGFYSMNLLGPVDPQGWSYLFKGFTNSNSWGEGFSYMGLGVITFGLFALVGIMRKLSWGKEKINSTIKKYPFLCLLLIGLFAFAISHHISIGDHTWVLSPPKWFLPIADIIRSSARMFWPVHYLFIIGWSIIILGCYSSRNVFTIFTLCLLLQIADTSSGWKHNREQLAIDQSEKLQPNRLSSPFWNKAAPHFNNLVMVPTIDMPPNWEQFAIYAANYHLKTNAIHMARIDLKKQVAANQKLDAQINSGQFDRDTLYIVENRYVIPALATSPDNTAIAKIDTFNVIAPNWNNCSNCPPINPKMLLNINRFVPKLNRNIFFNGNNPDVSYYLRQGWSWTENWGTWSEGKTAVLNLAWPNASSISLELKMNAFITDKQPTQDIDVVVNKVHYAHIKLNQTEDNHLKIDFNSEMKAQKYISIEFHIQNPTAPASLDMNVPDKRQLGIGIISAIFY